MNRTLATQAAFAQLLVQAEADSELVISDMDELGRVQVEGTVDLAAVVLAALDKAKGAGVQQSGAGQFGGSPDPLNYENPHPDAGTITPDGNVVLFDGHACSCGTVGIRPDEATRQAAEAAGWTVTATAGSRAFTAHRDRSK